jgi:hypothetical protein
MWLKVTTAGLVMKVRSLQQQIDQSKDAVVQNKLIAQQNNLLSYISGLGIAVSSSDRALLNRLKSGIVGKRK